MSTLLLRLSGPMQAWGSQDRFSVRFTEREPTKSGVIGLVCAALGRPRSEDVDDLAACRFGVRVDAEGVVQRDYHTAGGTHRRGERYGVARASGSVSYDAVPSTRYYLADADFLAGLESEDNALLRTVEEAVQRPVWQLFLGRKAFVPGAPVGLPGPGGLRAGVSLEQALADEPWPGAGPVPPRDRPERLRCVIECEPGTSGEVRQDQPVGAAFATRTFVPRYVRTSFLELATIPLRSESDVSFPADP